MPIMPAVIKCVRCGANVTVTFQSREDPRFPSLPLSELVKLHAAHCLCPACRQVHNWHASQGRSAEFDQTVKPPLEALTDAK